MPQYIMQTPSGRVTKLGDFPNLEEVYKLRFLKEHPEYKCYVKSVPPKIKQPSNRWRVIYSDFYIDLAAPYWNKREVIAMLETVNPIYFHAVWEKIRKVPKRCYHDNDI